MEKIPKYSYDLIDELDKLVLPPEYPRDERMIAMLNDAAVRAIAFRAGQRAIVQMLIDMRREIEEEKVRVQGGVTVTNVDPDDPLGPVLDPDGNPHTTVASVHVAARLVDEMPDAVREADDGLVKSE